MMNNTFRFLHDNDRPAKPRSTGLTEIRGPYYSVMGRRYLRDLLEGIGDAVDSLKFAGGSFSLLADDVLRDLIATAHEFGVEVSTGGFMEYVLTQGTDAVHAYIDACKRVGFDTIELSAGFITLPGDDWLRLVERVARAGLKAKPEVGIQFGAGGASPEAALQAEGSRDPSWIVRQAQRFIDAGASMIMIESEGITENVTTWRTDVPATVVNELGLDKVMFEAAAPDVFTWYVKNYGPDVNLFVDHSQILQLECLRRGIWGMNSLWGRVVTYKAEVPDVAREDGRREGDRALAPA